MPKIERQAWRDKDAPLLREAKIVGRAQGTAADGGRFDGLIIERKGSTKQWVAYWRQGAFLVEELAPIGSLFTCETCQRLGAVGTDGPFFSRDGLDRDPRDPALGWCRNCPAREVRR